MRCNVCLSVQTIACKVHNFIISLARLITNECVVKKTTTTTTKKKHTHTHKKNGRFPRALKIHPAHPQAEFGYFTAVSGVGSSPALATCDVPGGLNG